MKVVVDNTVSNVAPFPGLNLSDVAQMARNFAEALDSGKIPDISCAMLIIQDEQGVIDSMQWGGEITTTEAIGILELAKSKIVRDSYADDGD